MSEIQNTGRLVDRRVAERITLAAAIDAYIAEVTDKRPSVVSQVSERTRLQRFKRAEPFLCGHAVAYITWEMMEAWRDRRLTELPSRGKAVEIGKRSPEAVPPGRFRKDGTPRKNAAGPKPPAKSVSPVSPGTVRREMTLLKRVFDFSMRRYKLVSNPLDKSLVDRPIAQDARDVRISVEDWARLLEECRKCRSPWVAPFVELALEIGVRKGSLIKARWDHVHAEEAFINLQGVKNSREPTVVRNVEVGLSPRAIEILSSLPRSLDGRIFPVHVDLMNSAFKRARSRAGLEHFRLHDTRHELASRLVEAGWEMLDVMRQGDWRDPKSLSRYYNAKGSHLGSKLAKLPLRH